jgi:SAM-dependent methyltransferase
VRARDRLLFGPQWDIRKAIPERFVRAAFQTILRRDPDPGGLQNYLTALEEKTLTPDGVLDELISSMELRIEHPFQNILRSLHQSRCDFVRMYPRARRILDLGGADQGEDAGALVSMGYPYRFELLTVVELPSDQRHSLYEYRPADDRVMSRCGPVEYRYHSMTDLSAYPNASFDLVSSGQTIEHITEDDARKMLTEVRRVLEPGGWFCVDTPNRRVTELQTGADLLTNPDHKLEYTHEQLSAMLVEAGFEITGAYGLNLAAESVRNSRFDTRAVAAQRGVFHEIADCYILAYICRNREHA